MADSEPKTLKEITDRCADCGCFDKWRTRAMELVKKWRKAAARGEVLSVNADLVIAVLMIGVATAIYTRIILDKLDEILVLLRERRDKTKGGDAF